MFSNNQPSSLDFYISGTLVGPGAVGVRRGAGSVGWTVGLGGSERQEEDLLPDSRSSESVRAHSRAALLHTGPDRTGPLPDASRCFTSTETLWVLGKPNLWWKSCAWLRGSCRGVIVDLRCRSCCRAGLTQFLTVPHPSL
ncbi:hypothetical protein CCH79_00002490 [Gambusia affinis]|uniref:Uncharacterized protein n=1 Tax=Gambusia affinis TaxID=33528 RepID=A0A315VJE1_GAMAF|nr:hypothetical protein CCH79_00002490 [Gambusia affinis]